MIWLVHYLPEAAIIFVTSAILTLGVITTAVSWATKFLSNPILHMYRLPIQVLGNLLLALGVYFHGGYMIEMEWRGKLAETEKKFAEYKTKSREGDVEIVEVIKEKIVTVEKKVDHQKKQNNANAEQINKDCTLSQDALDSYNRAVDIGNGKGTIDNSK